MSVGNVLNIELRSSHRAGVEGRFRCYLQSTNEHQWTIHNKLSESIEALRAPPVSPDYCSCGWRNDVRPFPLCTTWYNNSALLLASQ